MNGYARKWQVFRRSDAAKASICNFPGNDLLFIFRKHRNIVVLSMPSDDSYLGGCQTFFSSSQNSFFPPLNINSFKVKTPKPPFHPAPVLFQPVTSWRREYSLIYTISHSCDFVLIGVVKHVDRVKLLIATVLWRVIRKKSSPHYSHLALPWHSCSAAWLKDN